MTSLENRMLLVENNIEHINQSITEIRNDIRDLNAKIDGVNTSLNARMDSNLKWLLSVILATWITTIGAVIGSAVAL